MLKENFHMQQAAALALNNRILRHMEYVWQIICQSRVEIEHYFVACFNPIQSTVAQNFR